ncbi:TAXI family TRAP transporter solute-binding subunit [Nitratireductor sp. GCM10026969]|uniref:TAXI family TRAP transporter solute-binding subunit n=1 Tax=Nitratireductor sp. GCM10026969 TaxID=3252645 RepID=UPI0036151E06
MVLTKLLRMLVPVALIAGSTVAVPAQEALGDPSWNYDLVLGGGSATGNSKILASALGKIVTENVEGVRASGAVVPGFDAESVIHTHNGTMHGGVGTPLVITNATQGVAPFPSDGVDVKFWFAHNEVPLNILAQKDAGITKISELAGKTVALAPPGTSNYLFTEIILQAHGLEVSDLNVRTMDTSEAINQLQNGSVDAISYVRDYSGAILELSTARDIVLLQPEKEALDKIQQRIPWAGPKKWPFVDDYPNLEVPGEALVFVSPEFMFLDGDLENELVYAMTKAVWENIEEVRRSSQVFAEVNLEGALSGVPIEPHPGALLYYREMDVPGWEQYADLIPEQ